ncbi:MAG: hypoxanthine phosphoribosyltransferase [Bacteroidia bacterium]|nr:hypoxanthine phosphoribosyltransferase [Bacteroidia bacterium]
MPPETRATVQIGQYQFVTYITEEQIRHRVAELGARLNHDYAGRTPLMLVILNGAFMFAADLIRELTMAPEIEFVRISTYGDSMTSSENAQVLLGLEIEVDGRDVIIVEDIVDTGYTTQYLQEYLEQQGPASVRLVTLLFKPDNFKGGTPPDYVGFDIPPAFVVGYGLDYAQRGRELRCIYQQV